MSKFVIPFAIGIAAGVMAAWIWLTPQTSPDERRLVSPESRGSLAQSGNGPDSRTGAGQDAAASANSVAALARQDSAGALGKALLLQSPGVRRRAVLQIGEIWASTDPNAALAATGTLPEVLREGYLSAVSLAWANLDPEAFFTHAAASPDAVSMSAGLKLLIPSDPARVFEIASRMPESDQSGSLARRLQIDAISALADRNPAAAAELVESRASENALYDLLRRVAARYARADPDAALAWFETPEIAANIREAVRSSLIAGITMNDFDRGFELFSRQQISDSFVAFEMSDQLVGDPDMAAEMADRLLDMDGAHAQQLLMSVTSRWASRDAEALMRWLVDRSDRIDPTLARAVALQFASSDLDFALEQVDRLPTAMRQAWVVQAAGAYAERDPASALDWITRYRGQASYDDAYTQIVMQAAQSRPEFLAQRFNSLSDALRVAAAPSIANAWAQTDPVAAADWVASLQGAARESSAIDRVVDQWAQVDPKSTQSWVLDSLRGPMRQAGIMRLLTATNRNQVDVATLVNELDLESGGTAAAVRAAYALRDVDPDRARGLLEPFIGDPEYGRSVRQALEYIDELQQ